MKLSVVYLNKNVFEFGEEPGYFLFREVVSDFVQRRYFFFGQGDGFIHCYPRLILLVRLFGAFDLTDSFSCFWAAFNRKG